MEGKRMTNQLTITGNLAGTPELRFSQSGNPVANFTIADTPRKYNKATSEWEDGTTLWMRCVAFKELAENTAESLRRGDRVTATGRLTQVEWLDKNTGEKRVGFELIVDEVGPSLRRATAKVVKATRQDGPAPQQSTTQGAWGGPQQAPQADPWQTAMPTDEPAF